MYGNKTQTYGNKTEKLQTRDLIAIGILSAVFVVVYFILGMTIGPIPLTFLFLTTVAAVPSGVIFMLLLAKVPKAGALSIAGIVFGLVLFMSGHFWLMLVIAIAGAVLADIIYSTGNRKSFGRMAAAFTVYMVFFAAGAYSPMLLFSDSYFESMGGAEGPYATYFTEVLSYLTWPVIGLIICGTTAGSVVGAFLGKKLLHKHFRRAGIV